jgi:hypothetical protein
MIDPTFVRWIIDQTGLVGVAALALLMLRQAYMERDSIRSAQIRDAKTNLDSERIRSDAVLKALQEQARTSAELAEVLREFKGVFGPAATQHGSDSVESGSSPRGSRTRKDDVKEARE